MHDEGTFSIGEFSRITGLTVKALRFYQEKNLLIPALIDPDSQYRYYRVDQIQRARTISQLRQLQLPLRDIQRILSASNDGEILAVLQEHRQTMDRRAKESRSISNSLKQLINQGGDLKKRIHNSSHPVIEKTLPQVLVAGIRMKGRYSECGAAFGKLGRSFGRLLCGKPMMLIYDEGYREDDADFEVCFPVKSHKHVQGINVTELPGGSCLSILHQGPYDQLGNAYEKILTHAKQSGYTLDSPCREIYLKGPGMLIRGNPKNYLTEIQMLFQNPTSPT